jgi:hypothetical protein
MKKTKFMLPIVIRRKIAKKTKNVSTINILSHYPDFYVIKNLAENPATPQTNLIYFIESKRNTCIKESVASNININEEICEILVNESSDVREFLARNNKILEYPKIQEKLSNDSSKYVRYFIARYSNIEEIIEKLSNDEEEFVQVGVSENKHLSVKKQYELSKSSNYMVIIGLLGNSIIDSDILDNFANSTNVNFRIRVAGNLNTRIDTLERLKNDTDKKVSNIAKVNLKNKNKTLKYYYKFIR